MPGILSTIDALFTALTVGLSLISRFHSRGSTRFRREANNLETRCKTGGQTFHSRRRDLVVVGRFKVALQTY